MDKDYKKDQREDAVMTASGANSASWLLWVSQLIEQNERIKFTKSTDRKAHAEKTIR